MYEKIFHSENPFWNGMGRLFDIVELNLLWLVCSLPLFTVGSASAALYSAMAALLRGKETYPHRDFSALSGHISGGIRRPDFFCPRSARSSGRMSALPDRRGRASLRF